MSTGICEKCKAEYDRDSGTCVNSVAIVTQTSRVVTACGGQIVPMRILWRRTVHAISWASQPDIIIKCTQLATTPAWGAHPMVAEPNVPDKVFRAISGDYYTFEPSLVTCPRCTTS